MYFFLLKMEKVGGELGVCGRVWECGKPNGFSIISMPWSEGEKGTYRKGNRQPFASGGER